MQQNSIVGSDGQRPQGVKVVLCTRKTRARCSPALTAVQSIRSRKRGVPRTYDLLDVRYARGFPLLLQSPNTAIAFFNRLLEPLMGSRALESNGRTQFINALLTLSVKSGVDPRPRTSLRGTCHPRLVPRRQAVIYTIQGEGGCPDVTSPLANSPHATL